MASNHTDSKDTEVNLMEELLDEGEDFILTQTEDKSNKRHKKSDHINGTTRIKVKKDKDLTEPRHKSESKSSSKDHRERRKKTVRVPKMEGSKKDHHDIGFDTRSEASSDHDDEPSMSDGSKHSSPDREREHEEKAPKRKRSPSVNSAKSMERESPKKVEEPRPKKKYDYMTKINYMFRETRFFLIKSNNAENVDIAMARNVWSTFPQNEAKLNQAFQESRNVILIFSVKESGKFCGLCRLSEESRRDLPPVDWVLPPGLPARALEGVFPIDWISKKELSFIKTQHLYNPWNEGKPVKIGRDGQEIEPRVAEEVCRLIPKDETINLTPILHKSKKSAKERRVRGPLRRPVGIITERRGNGRGTFFRDRGGGYFRDRGGYQGGYQGRGMRMDNFG